MTPPQVDQFYQSCLDEWQPGLTELTKSIAGTRASPVADSAVAESQQRDLSSYCQRLDELRGEAGLPGCRTASATNCGVPVAEY